jgi:hypothetical protein
MSAILKRLREKLLRILRSSLLLHEVKVLGVGLLLRGTHEGLSWHLRLLLIVELWLRDKLALLLLRH